MVSGLLWGGFWLQGHFFIGSDSTGSFDFQCFLIWTAAGLHLGFLGTLDVDTSLELWLNDGLNKDVKRLKEIIRQVHDDDGIKKSVPKKLTLQSLQKRIGVLFKWDPADEASKLQGPADAGQDTGGSSGCSPML